MKNISEETRSTEASTMNDKLSMKAHRRRRRTEVMEMTEALKATEASARAKIKEMRMLSS